MPRGVHSYPDQQQPPLLLRQVDHPVAALFNHLNRSYASYMMAVSSYVQDQDRQKSQHGKGMWA
ncbi:mCG142654, isoform CRA_a [Mus musculus]|nr:mCG142654, isoform CRA_a [Mus musculus]EDL23837.1 mCG142654, isoform CRA_a [Mus musculus]